MDHRFGATLYIRIGKGFLTYVFIYIKLCIYLNYLMYLHILTYVHVNLYLCVFISDVGGEVSLDLLSQVRNIEKHAVT